MGGPRIMDTVRRASPGYDTAVQQTKELNQARGTGVRGSETRRDEEKGLTCGNGDERGESEAARDGAER